MRKRLARVLLIASIAGLVLTTAAVLASFTLDPTEERLSLGDSFHIALGFPYAPFCQFILFNDAEYGPYHGSMVMMGEDMYGGVKIHRAKDKRWGPPSLGGYKRSRYVTDAGTNLITLTYGGAPGIYYRNFRFPDSHLWTLMIALWWPALLFVIGIILSVVLRRPKTKGLAQ